MRYCQLEAIHLLEPGKQIEASRTLRADEDCLRDHFPRFAVMPGVMMLEALYQASALLVRATEGYQSGLVLLRSTKNVKFADFVQPGQTLTIHAELMKQDGDRYLLKATGRKNDVVAVSGRLIVECVQDDSPDVVRKHAAHYMRQLTEQLQQAAMA